MTRSQQSSKFHIRWPNYTVLEYGPLHDLEKIQPVLTKPILKERRRELGGETYRWSGLDKPERENPFLRFESFPLALTIVFMGQSVDAKDFLLFIRIGRKVGKQKVKE